jgi:hypothetical protein
MTMIYCDILSGYKYIPLIQYYTVIYLVSTTIYLYLEGTSILALPNCDLPPGWGRNRTRDISIGVIGGTYRDLTHPWSGHGICTLTGQYSPLVAPASSARPTLTLRLHLEPGPCRPSISKVGKWPSISDSILQLDIKCFDIRYRMLKIW